MFEAVKSEVFESYFISRYYRYLNSLEVVSFDSKIMVFELNPCSGNKQVFVKNGVKPYLVSSDRPFLALLRYV